MITKPVAYQLVRTMVGKIVDRVPSKRWLFTPLLIGCVLGGYLPPGVAEDWLAALDQNMVPAFAFAIGFMCWWSVESRVVSRSDCLIIVGLSLMFVIPSTQISWLILLLSALWLSRNSHTQQVVEQARLRSGLLVIVLTALQPLLMTYSLKLLAAPILTADAALVAALLKITTGVGHHVGNVVYGPAEHQLLILRGCSSLANLGNAWLVWFALARFRGVPLHLRESAVIFLLSLLIVGLNLMRLYSMGTDLGWHEWWHSEAGMLVYQLMSMGLIAVVILLGIRYVDNQ